MKTRKAKVRMESEGLTVRTFVKRKRHVTCPKCGGEGTVEREEVEEVGVRIGDPLELIKRDIELLRGLGPDQVALALFAAGDLGDRGEIGPGWRWKNHPLANRWERIQNKLLVVFRPFLIELVVADDDGEALVEKIKMPPSVEVFAREFQRGEWPALLSRNRGLYSALA